MNKVLNKFEDGPFMTTHNKIEEIVDWIKDNRDIKDSLEILELRNKLKSIISETLQDYTNFLLANGYCDDDVWSEEPKAVERYLDTYKP